MVDVGDQKTYPGQWEGGAYYDPQTFSFNFFRKFLGFLYINEEWL